MPAKPGASSGATTMAGEAPTARSALAVKLSATRLVMQWVSGATRRSAARSSATSGWGQVRSIMGRYP